MTSWTRTAGSKTFTRSLGGSELVFYWDSSLAGGADILQQVVVEVRASQAPRIFSQANISRAWVALKQLNPLLGATVIEREGDKGDVDFIVDETRLDAVGPNEIIFRNLQSDAEAITLCDRILNEPRSLSNECLSQIWIVQLPQHRPNAPTVRGHLMFLTAHYVCDGVGQIGIIKTFVDLLTREEATYIYEARESLESRLALVPPAEELSPTAKFSLARQRWRFAIARLICSRRLAKFKGGHTLPRTLTPHTTHTPAVTRTLRIVLPKDLSSRILLSCKRKRITFGSALRVLAQLAHVRILHQLHSRGLVSDKELAYGTKQPIHMSGTVNLRPYLDSEWLRHGGMTRVCLAIAESLGDTLPGLIEPVSGGVEPHLSDLLSRKMFFHKCRLSQKQTASFGKHPLLMEFSRVTTAERLARARESALLWRAQDNKFRPEDSGAQRDVQEVFSGMTDPVSVGFVRGNACGTVGSMDPWIPHEYPLNHTGSPKRDHPPLLRIASILNYFRCHPMDLYLNSLAFDQKIQLVVFCDARVYDETIVGEWLGEVRAAAEWYLGNPAQAERRLGVERELRAML